MSKSNITNNNNKNEKEKNKNNKYISFPLDIVFERNLVNDSFSYGVQYDFVVFKSFNNKIYIVFSNRQKSIISYDLNDYKKINEIKNAHNYYITNFRYLFDIKEYRDLLISISNIDNNIKLWNVINFECLLNLENIYLSGYLESACFIKDKINIYIATSNYYYNENLNIKIKVFDLKGNKIKEINDSNKKVNFIDSYKDINSNKNYLITCNDGFAKSYDYNENKEYHTYADNDYESQPHISGIINNEEKIIKFIESSKDGHIRIWNFHNGELIEKININESLFGICLWNDDYLFVCCSDNSIKIFDLKNKKILKQLLNDDLFISIQKIKYFDNEEYIISKSNIGKIKIFGRLKIKNVE